MDSYDFQEFAAWFGTPTLEQTVAMLRNFRTKCGHPVIVNPVVYSAALRAGIPADLMQESKPIPKLGDGKSVFTNAPAESSFFPSRSRSSGRAPAARR